MNGDEGATVGEVLLEAVRSQGQALRGMERTIAELCVLVEDQAEQIGELRRLVAARVGERTARYEHHD